MKIVMINSVCGIGSTGRICTDLAQTLEENGHICKISYGRENVPEKVKKYAIRIGCNLDVKLHGVYSRLFDLHGFGSRSATKKFVKWLKEFDPDIIHLHNIHGYYINIDVLFKYLRTCGKKIIWTFHDGWAFTGHCACFAANGCYSWREDSCKKCRYFKAYPKSVFLHNSKRNFIAKRRLFANIPEMTIVTPSEWLGNLVKESFLKDTPVQVIRNGIDLSAFSKDAGGDMVSKYGLKNKKIVLGVANVWSSRKGLFDLIKLASMLPDDYKVVLVGLSKEQVESLPSNIVGITRTNNVNELAELYAAATVFFNPTYEDNFPTTNIEALACGTPVITYKTGGSPESIGEGCGFVFEKGDVAGVANAIVAMKDKTYYRDICATHAQRFDKRKMCEDYCNIYKEDF